MKILKYKLLFLVEFPSTIFHFYMPGVYYTGNFGDEEPEEFQIGKDK